MRHDILKKSSEKIMYDYRFVTDMAMTVEMIMVHLFTMNSSVTNFGGVQFPCVINKSQTNGFLMYKGAEDKLSTI